MYSFKICIALALLNYCSFLFVSGASISNNTESRNSSESSNSTDSFDDRFNLNLQLAGAHGFGKNGGFSQANSLSYGTNVGIRRPGGQYENLFSNSGANSNGYSTGPGAPLSFANTGSRVRPGYAGGNANSGVIGGKGSAFAQSVNQNIEIPLDNRGTVLLSNLRERDNSTSTNPPPKEQTTAKSDKESGGLIFN